MVALIVMNNSVSLIDSVLDMKNWIFSIGFGILGGLIYKLAYQK